MIILRIPIVFIFLLIGFHSQALIEGDTYTSQDGDTILSRCEAQSNNEMKLACYQQQLQFLGAEGHVQTDEGFVQTQTQLNPEKKCFRDFCIGETVFYNPDDDTWKAMIIDIDESNLFSIKTLDDDDDSVVLSLKKEVSFDQLIKANGCHYGVCVGDRVYQVRSKDSNNVRKKYLVEVVGISHVGEFTVDYVEDYGGEFKSRYGSKWDLDNIARMDGCYQHVCVGEEYIRVRNEDRARVKIIAITYQNWMIIEYLEGDLANGEHHGYWNVGYFVPID